MSPEWLKHPNAKALVTEADGAYGLCADSAPPVIRDMMQFYRGVLCALAHVAVHDQEGMYREIVDAVGCRELIAACENWEDAEWNGLARYGYVGKRSKLYRDSQASARASGSSDRE